MEKTKRMREIEKEKETGNTKKIRRKDTERKKIDAQSSNTQHKNPHNQTQQLPSIPPSNGEWGGPFLVPCHIHTRQAPAAISSSRNCPRHTQAQQNYACATVPFITVWSLVCGLPRLGHPRPAALEEVKGLRDAAEGYLRACCGGEAQVVERGRGARGEGRDGGVKERLRESMHVGGYRVGFEVVGDD
ncbi:hypothetical protein E2C01_028609 [Portunus trituberculatus]|uniref:Uncharacterized protein n=1 Tax=Portunus trituberculatus TaxID=210409 RepID=A0A5B7EL44_PORTR|nr:hypothetical protein [Portunus trituberculatus]